MSMWYISCSSHLCSCACSLALSLTVSHTHAGKHTHMHTHTPLNYANISSSSSQGDPPMLRIFLWKKMFWWMKNSWDCFQIRVWHWTQLKKDKLEESASNTQNLWVNCTENRHRSWGMGEAVVPNPIIYDSSINKGRLLTKIYTCSDIKIWQKIDFLTPKTESIRTSKLYFCCYFMVTHL